VTAHALHPGNADGGTGVGVALRSWTLFDIPIAVAQPPEVLATISDWASQRTTHRVMHVDAHLINRSRTTPELANALRRADLVYGEGESLRLAARVLNRPVPDRMTARDWISGLAAVHDLPGPSFYLLGSEPPLAQHTAQRLRCGYPRFEVLGAHHGFFDMDSAHNERVIEDINDRQPQIVLVDMGTPKQELWVDRYADRLGGAVVWTVSGLFDYVPTDSPRPWRAHLVDNSEFLLSVVAKAGRDGR